MSIIRVKYDPTLVQSEIIARLDNSSPEEAGDDYQKNPVEIQQTSVYGVMCPIIAINNVMVAVEDIWSFTLNDTGRVPSVDLTIYDRKKLIEYLRTPGNDNELRVQILPPFDDAYKKINLSFFITSFSQGSRGELYISASYKLSNFTSTKFKSFGQISLYNLCDSIASESKLGFATNVEDAGDNRYIYCPYISYQNTIDREINRSGNKTLIYDYWIDVWNYLNLVDMYERYNAIDSDEDMQIWISGEVDEVTESVEIKPVKTKAELTNLFGSEETQLYVKEYRVLNSPGRGLADGTDKVYSIYSMNENEYHDNYISDGDIKKDIFENFEYCGEVYGDYDYITNGIYRAPFLQKMKSNMIEVDLDNPLLGLHRGGRCVFECYYNNDMYDYTVDVLKDAGIMNNDPQTYTPIEELNTSGSDTFKLNKSISGQYLIIGNVYRFFNRRWTQTVILTRPIDQKPNILNVEE